MSYASDLRLTNADVECMPDDGNRYELIDGELYVSAAPGFLHQAAGRFRAAPEIVIEILSPGTSNIRRDRHVKLSLYNANGVEEYWIVDPENRSVEINRRNEAGDLV